MSSYGEIGGRDRKVHQNLAGLLAWSMLHSLQALKRLDNVLSE